MFPSFVEPNVNNRVHRNPMLLPILSKKNEVHTITPYNFDIHFNIITTTKSRTSKSSNYLSTFWQKLCMHLSYLSYLAHLNLLEHKTAMSDEDYKLRNQFHALFCSLLLFPPPRVQMFSSAGSCPHIIFYSLLLYVLSTKYTTVYIGCWLMLTCICLGQFRESSVGENI
jgi:hypothetical protein